MRIGPTGEVEMEDPKTRPPSTPQVASPRRSRAGRRAKSHVYYSKKGRLGRRSVSQAHSAGVQVQMAARERPAIAKGIVFISLEDESGLLDLVVKPDTWARLRDVLGGSMLLLVEGTVQRSGRAASVLVQEPAPRLQHKLTVGDMRMCARRQYQLQGIPRGYCVDLGGRRC